MAPLPIYTHIILTNHPIHFIACVMDVCRVCHESAGNGVRKFAHLSDFHPDDVGINDGVPSVNEQTIMFGGV